MAGDPIAYLDHAASTPMRAAALEALVDTSSRCYANPTGAHRLAREARRILEESRDAVAASLGCAPAEVVFTSGGTEADNLAVRGVLAARGGVAVCSAVEHHAVLRPVEAAGGRVVAVTPDGTVDLDALAAALGPDVSIVSVMFSNNETGVVQPLDPVAALVAELAPQAVLHTDAVQAAAWFDLTAAAAPAGLVSVSAHKFGGPKGVGALVVRDGVELVAQVLGGGQEHELRSGTQDVPGIAAMAAALVDAGRERAAYGIAVAALRDRLLDGLLDAVPGARSTARRELVVPGIAHLVIDGIESESLLFLMERGGVMASAASSCASGAMDPSHVLAAMGFARDEALGSLRLSLGHTSTPADVDLALDVIPAAVRRLRRPVGTAV
jgi:cysteine desulfurase